MAERRPYNSFTKQQLADEISKKLTKRELVTILEENDGKKVPKRTSPTSSPHGRKQGVAAMAASPLPPKRMPGRPPRFIHSLPPGTQTRPLQEKLNMD